jgi:hypothetical protein
MDIRYLTVKALIASKEIEDFGSIFKHIPYTLVARDCGISARRLKGWIANPENIQFGLLLRLSELLECDYETLLNLILGNSRVLQSMIRKSTKRR